MLAGTIALVVAAGVPALVSSAAASHTTCAVRVAMPPAGNDGGWTAEASNLRRRIHGEWGPGDCTGVKVQVDSNGRGGWLEFADREGGVARRYLARAAELTPAVHALLIKVDAHYYPDDLSIYEESPPDQVVEKEVRKSGPAAFAYGVAVGLRAGVASGTAIQSPLFGGFATVQTRRWEFGIGVQWESGYRQAIVDQEPDWRASALAMGITAGRRVPLGSWDLAAGLALGAAMVRGQSDDESPHTIGERTDARVGTYLGFIGPRASRLRFRTMLGADFIPSRIGASGPDESVPANLPWWMATISIGMEAGMP